MQRRLREHEVQFFDSFFRRWKTKTGFRREYERAWRICGEFMLIERRVRLKDAYLALECAQFLGASSIRLGSDPPDFELIVGNETRLFEAVEVIDPRRRRNLEIKQRSKSPTPDETSFEHLDQSQMNKEDHLAEIQLVEQAEKKSRKCYPPGTELVIYKNCGWVGHRWDTWLSNSFNYLEPACKRFKRVHILCSRGLVLISEDARPASISFQEADLATEHELSEIDQELFAN